MKKLNAKGFAHQMAIMAVVVVAVIGGIGSYVYLKSSSASTSTKTGCERAGGVWKDLRSNDVDHGPCWTTPGAYLVNYGKGGVHVDQVPSSGNNPDTGNKQSKRYDYPNYIIVVSRYWKVCDDVRFSGDWCTQKAFGKGAYSLCTPYNVYIDATVNSYKSNYTMCSHPGVYIERL